MERESCVPPPKTPPSRKHRMRAGRQSQPWRAPTTPTTCFTPMSIPPMSSRRPSRGWSFRLPFVPQHLDFAAKSTSRAGAPAYLNGRIAASRPATRLDPGVSLARSLPSPRRPRSSCRNSAAALPPLEGGTTPAAAMIGLSKYRITGVADRYNCGGAVLRARSCDSAAFSRSG